MRKLLWIAILGMMLGGCAILTQKPQYEIGMEEADFLKMHKEAVISKLEDGQRTYRVVRDDHFYLLATFENGRLVMLEEKELPTYWPQSEQKEQK